MCVLIQNSVISFLIDIVFLGLSNKLSLVRLKTYKLYYFKVVFIIFSCDNK